MEGGPRDKWRRWKRPLKVGLWCGMELVLISLEIRDTSFDYDFGGCRNTKTTRVNDSIDWSTRLYSRRLN
jgi:hypothetical protein